MISIRHQRRAVMATAALVAGVTALSGVTSNAATAPKGSHARAAEARTGGPSEVRGHYDIRTAGGAAAQAALARGEARAAQRAGSIDGALVDFDGLTGTPRMLGKLDGFLTGKSDKKPATIALNYVKNHASAMGLASSDVKTFTFRDDYKDITGTHHLSWVQKFDGEAFFGFGLKAAVDKKGRLLMVGGSPIPASIFERARIAPPRAITNRGQAITSARRSAGDSTRAVQADDSAERMLFFAGKRGIYHAWVTITTTGSNPAVTVQDAASGKLLYRQPLTQDERAELPARKTKKKKPAATGVAFPAYSNQAYRDVNFTKKGWLPRGSKTLNGNNAHAYSDVNDDNKAQASEEVGPKKGAKWNYKLKPFDLPDIPGMNDYCGNPFPCSWDPDTENSWKTNRAQNTVQTFFFVNTWHDVLKAAPYGFTEDAGNFQVKNPSGKGKGGDAVRTNTLDGANTNNGLPDGQHIDNANMSTPPDGKSPTMQMYLQHQPGTAYSFDGDPFPANNTGDEGDTVYHEYTHGLSNRLVIDPNGFSALGPVQAGAMGEAWGDFYATSYLVKQGLREDTPASGELWLGHADGLGKELVRTEPMDCPVGDDGGDCFFGGYTYADYAQIIGQPEVHADGEIWGQTLWDLRGELGYNTTMGLVTRAMELAPFDPSMIDMRNALLMADTAIFGGSHHATIWDVFAHRGMGFYAGSLGGEDAAPGASFDTPPAGNEVGTVSGTVTDSVTHEPVAGVPITLAFQGANTLVNPTAFTDEDGNYEIGPVPTGTYPKLLVNGGAGYVPVTDEVTVTTEGAVKDFAVTRDWAAESGGATVADFNGPDYSPDCGPYGAIDLSQATGWGSTTGGDDAPLTNVFVPKYIVIELPTAVDIDTFGIDPTATCGDGGSASTGDYKIETSADGETWTEAASGTFTSDDRGLINLVPPTAGDTGVNFVKFHILGNQTPDFATNCPAGAFSGCQFTDLTEIEVFGTPSS